MLMRKFFIVATFASLLGASSLAVAANLSANKPGPYVGVQAGISQIDPGSGPKKLADKIANLPGPADISKDIDKGGFGGRLFIGWNFNHYFSVEGGFSHYAANKYNANWMFNSGVFDTKDDVHYHVKVHTYVLDLTGKALFPLAQISPILSHWHLYAKLGIAHITAKLDGNINSGNGPNVPADLQVGNKNISSTNSAWRPTYGLGIDYAFNHNFAIDLSWMGVSGKNKLGTAEDVINSHKFTPTTNLVAIGFSYKFTSL